MEDAAQRAIAGLFPAFARCAVLPVSDQCRPLFPVELHAVANAVPVRRQEFACGRACAHAAIRELGIEDAPILMSDSREPAWPLGAVGSISHTRELAAAVVCRSADAHAVGVDLERADAALSDTVLGLILTPGELAQVGDLLSADERAAALIFSAKEAVHKVVAPLAGYRPDPQSVEVAVDLAACRFTAAVRRPVDASPLVLRGAFCFVDGHVATGVCVPRAQ